MLNVGKMFSTSLLSAPSPNIFISSKKQTKRIHLFFTHLYLVWYIAYGTTAINPFLYNKKCVKDVLSDGFIVLKKLRAHFYY